MQESRRRCGLELQLLSLSLGFAVAGAACSGAALTDTSSAAPEAGTLPAEAPGAPAAAGETTPAAGLEANPDTAQPGPSHPPTAAKAGANPKHGAGEQRAAQSAPPDPGPPPALPKGTTVLHVGDSFAGALGIELNKIFKQNDVRGVLRYTTASYIPNWAGDGKLRQYMLQYDPDLVLITLGANELEIDDPERRIDAIERIVEHTQGTPCVWIAIPLWDGPKNGLLDVIRDHLGHCVYMDTNALYPDMPRAGDKIHPTMQARVDWAAFVADWLARKRQPTGEHVWALR